MNLRDKILNKNDVQTEIVYVKEWDVKVEVRGMSGETRADYFQTTIIGSGKDAKMDFKKMYPELVINCTFEPETGERLFQPEDRDILNKKSGAALERIAKVAMRLSGLDPEEKEKTEKN